MKKHSFLILIVILTKLTQAHENIFSLSDNRSFLTNVNSISQVEQGNDDYNKVIEEDDYITNEYDSVVSVQAEPVPLSPIKRFMAQVFGKILIYYFSFKEKIDSYYKKYKGAISDWFVRSVHG